MNITRSADGLSDKAKKVLKANVFGTRMEDLTPMELKGAISGYELRHRIEALVGGITAREIKHSYKGSGAFTGEGIMTLPTIPQTHLFLKRDADILLGYAAHEISHQLESDFDMIMAIFKDVQNPTKEELQLKEWWNAIEDYRIEKITPREYPGFRNLINETRDHTTQQFIDMADEGMIDPERLGNPYAIGAVALTWVGAQLNGYTTTTSAEALKRLDPELAKWIISVKPRMAKVETKQDSFDLARELLDELEQSRTDEDQKGNPNPDESDNQGDQNQDSDDDGSGQSNGASGDSKNQDKADSQADENDDADDAEEGDSGNKCEEEGDREGGEPNSGQHDDREDDSADDDEGSEPKDAADNESSDGDDGETSPESDSTDDQGNGSNPADDDDSDEDRKASGNDSENGQSSSGDEAGDDGDDSGNGESSQSDDANDGQGTKDSNGAGNNAPATTEKQSQAEPDQSDLRIEDIMDAINALAQAVDEYEASIENEPGCGTPQEVEMNQREYARIKMSMGSACARTSGIIRRLLMSQNRTKTQRNMEDGSLDLSRLVPIVGGAKDVYKRTTIKRDVNTAVSILLDNSGSMGGYPIELCQRAAIVLDAAIAGTGTDLEVNGFTGNTINPTIYQYRKFGQKAQSSAATLGSMGTIGLGGTPVGVPILEATRRLMSHKSVRKVMIIVSDGHAEDVQRAREAHDLALLRGISVVGIGIGTGGAAIGQWCDNHQVINEVEELPNALATVVQRALSSNTMRRAA